MNRQKLGLNLSFCLALTASLAGCGGTKTVNSDEDLTMTVALPDMTTQPDLTPAGAFAGSACTANSDCAASVAGSSKAPLCIKIDSITKLTFTNGYCSSPCRPAMTDMTSGINTDCAGGNATCQLTSQTTGRCVALCQVAATDCRVADGYVCEFNTPYAASCTPKDTNWCDPTKPTSCAKAMDGNAQYCNSFSPDNSDGECEEECDVFEQNCPLDANSNPETCVPGSTATAPADCLGSSGYSAGAACHYENDCAPGLICYNKLCEPYCRNGTGYDAGVANADAGQMGDVDCPSMYKCLDLVKGTEIPTKLGVCAPM